MKITPITRKNHPYRKRKFVKKIRKHTGVSKMLRLGHTISGDWNHPFPARMQCTLRTVMTVKTNSTTDNTIPGNPHESFYRLNAITSVGPAVNYPQGTSSVFAVNLASGLRYILSTPNYASATLSVSPYAKYLVKRSRIKVKYLPETFAGGSSHNQMIVVLPRFINNGQENNMTSNKVADNVLCEQPYAKKMLCPITITSKPVCISHQIGCKELAGLKTLDISNADYTASADFLPLQPMYWQVRVFNLDNSVANHNGTMLVEVEHDIEFFQRNYLTSQNVQSAVPDAAGTGEETGGD